LGRETRLGERASVFLPGAAREIADRGARGRVSDHDELPRLPVLGTRRVCRGFEQPADLGFADRRVAERAARALSRDDVEERLTHASLAPTRAKEFTYMIRRLGPNA